MVKKKILVWHPFRKLNWLMIDYYNNLHRVWVFKEGYCTFNQRTTETRAKGERDIEEINSNTSEWIF